MEHINNKITIDNSYNEDMKSMGLRISTHKDMHLNLYSYIGILIKQQVRTEKREDAPQTVIGELNHKHYKLVIQKT